jgi:hypothetical protein
MVFKMDKNEKIALGIFVLGGIGTSILLLKKNSPPIEDNPLEPIVIPPIVIPPIQPIPKIQGVITHYAFGDIVNVPLTPETFGIKSDGYRYYLITLEQLEAFKQYFSISDDIRSSLISGITIGSENPWRMNWLMNGDGTFFWLVYQQ